MKSLILSLSLLFVLGLLGCSNRPSRNLNDEMQHVVDGLVQNDISVKNCVLSVASGVGAFRWSGSAGIARERTPMTTVTPIYIASITKLYTATVVMRLFERGLLALDDPMAKYLPTEEVRGIHVYRGHDYSNEISIRQLLSHSSGIPDYYEGKGSDGRSLFDKFLEDQDRRWTVDETIERARKDLHPDFPPGGATSYSDTNFQLLGEIVEAVTGKPLAFAYEEVIFQPLGLKHTYLLSYDRDQTQRPTPADVFFKNTNITRIRSNGAY